MTDTTGNVIAWESAGGAGFKGSRKSTPFAAQVTADAAARKGLEQGLQKVEVYVKGPGSGRETAIRSLQAAGSRGDRRQGRHPAGAQRLSPAQAAARLSNGSQTTSRTQTMARDTSPQCKQCRREGQKLFLKGERCLTDKCGVERRSYPPGEHGRGRQKQSEYRVQLREKQKARRYYGVLEKQFHGYYEKASRQPGITGENLLALLECRLDNVLVRLGFAASRRQARQLIRHGHWTVNGRRVNIPSYQVRPGEVIAIKADTPATQVVQRRDRAHRTDSRVAAGRPRVAHGQGAAQAGATRGRRAGAGAAHRRAVLEVVGALPRAGAARGWRRRLEPASGRRRCDTKTTLGL